MKVILVAACIVAVLTVALLLVRRYDRVYNKAWSDFARAHAYKVLERDLPDFSTTLGTIMSDYSFAVTRAMEVETGSRNIFLLNGDYSRRRGTMHGSAGIFCLIESPRIDAFDTRVDVNINVWTVSLPTQNKVAMGAAEFDRNLIVSCEDPAAARRCVTPAIQQVFLDHATQPFVNPIEAVFGKGRALLVIGGSAVEPDRWLDLVEFAQKLEDSAK